MDKHRYWAIVNIIDDDPTYVSCGYFAFITSDGTISDNPDKMYAKNDYYKKYNVDILTNDENDDTKRFSSKDRDGFWIMYDFDTPVEVSKIKYRIAKKSLEWQTDVAWKSVTVTYSDDLVNWYTYGNAPINAVKHDYRYYICDVIKTQVISNNCMYWRLSNILCDNFSTNSMSVQKINFLNDKSLTNNNTSNVLFNHQLSSHRATHAFDNLSTTFAHNNDQVYHGVDWYIGYKFDEPVNVTKVGLQARYDMGWNYEQEIKRALVEYSIDGNEWHIAGNIIPNTKHMDLTYSEHSIVPLQNNIPDKHRYWRIIDLYSVYHRDNNYIPTGENNKTYRTSLRKLEMYGKDQYGNTVLSRSGRNGWCMNHAQWSNHSHWSISNVFNFTGNGVHPAYNDWCKHPEDGWFIVYDFKYPVDVKKIKCAPRNDAYRYEQSMLRCKLEYSDDGQNWTHKTYVHFSSYGEDKMYLGCFYDDKDIDILSIDESNSVTYSKYNLQYTRQSMYSNANTTQYNHRWNDSLLQNIIKSSIGIGVTGYIKGNVYGVYPPEKPISRVVYCNHYPSGTLISKTHSESDGSFLLKNLDVNSLYTVFSVDHTEKWGKEIEGYSLVAPTSVKIEYNNVMYP